MVTLAQLVKILPASRARAPVFIEPLNAAMAESQINTAARQAAFIPQIGHESMSLTKLTEGLNYSAERLMQVWPTRFPTLASTVGYARNPVALANHVYADRMGNGDERSGDGWRYRGAGLKQLTGKENHIACALHFDIDPDEVGDWLRTIEGACRSAAWFWRLHGLNELADVGNFRRITKVINGGYNGYDERLALYQTALGSLGSLLNHTRPHHA